MAPRSVDRRLVALLALLVAALGVATWLVLRAPRGERSADGPERTPDVETTDTSSRPAGRAHAIVPRGPARDTPDAPEASSGVPAPQASRIEVSVASETTDEPLPGAEVAVDFAAGGSRTGETDDAGVTRFDDVACGDAFVRASAPGHVAAEAVRTVPLGGTARVRLTLAEPAHLRFVVHDAWDGGTVAGATVEVLALAAADLPPDRERGAERPGLVLDAAVTDPHGRARVGAAPATDRVLLARVSGEGLETTWTALPPELLEADDEIPLHTARGGTVTGTVRSGDGGAVADARVCLLWRRRSGAPFGGPARVQVAGQPERAPAPRTLWWPLTTRADADGRFRFGGVRLGAEFRLVAVTEADDEGPRHGPLLLTPDRPALERDVSWPGFGDEATRPAAALVPPTRIGDAVVRGAVVDDRGRGVGGVSVDVRDLPHRTTTDADGAFVIRALPQGTHRLVVVSGGVTLASLPLRAPADDVRVVLPSGIADALGTPAELLPRTGTKLPERRDLVFTAVLADGAAAPAMLTTLLRGGLRATPWPAGARRLEVRLRLGASADRRLSDGAAIEVEIWGTGLRTRVTREARASGPGDVELGEILLDTGLSVSGVVVDDRGQPVGGAAVGATQAGRTWPGATAAADDGTFQLGGLGPGDARVWARADGCGTATVETTVGDDGARGVRVTLERLVELRLRVRDALGLPFDDAIVKCDDQAIDTRLATDRAGRSTLWLAPGRHVVRAWDPLDPPRRAEAGVDLARGAAATELVLTLPDRVTER